VKRDLKNWSIIKELALDRREWKLAIHVLEHSVSSLLLPFGQNFLLLFLRPFSLFLWLCFIAFSPFSVFFYRLPPPPLFLPLFCLCFSAHVVYL
jgi:hypothetical protein